MRIRLLLKTVLLTLFLIMGLHLTQGQIITTENFNFTDNALLINNGWVAHSGAGTASIDVGESNGLSYPGYNGLKGVNAAVPGNAARLDATGEDVSKVFTPIASGNLYYSFLINVTSSTTGYFMHLGASGTSFAARLTVKPSVNAGKINIGLSNSSTATYGATPTDLSLNTTYLIIVKYNISVTGDASLWIKSAGIPASEVDAGSPEITVTGGGLTTIDRICLRQYSGTQGQIIDDIRVAASWNDLINEDFPPDAVFTPAAASTTANPDENIQIAFNESVFTTDSTEISDPTSLITLKETDISGADVPFTASINAEKTIITVNPTPILGYTQLYYVAVSAVQDIFGNESSVQSATFTTRAQDIIAPEWTPDYPKVSAIANTDFNLLVNLNEPGKAYYVVLPDGSAAPTALQVKAGTNAADSPALKSGSISIPSANTEYLFNISGLNVATVYDVYVVAEDAEITPNLQTAVASVADVTTSDTKPEPANQPTAFAVTVNSQTALTLSWTDAVADQLPLGYLIQISETGTFTDPVDGVVYADGADAVNVAFGAGTKQLTGLVAGKQYFFRVFSYTNTGSAIDYLLTAPPAINVSLPKLVLTSPNGGETIRAGADTTIYWTSENVSNVVVEISSDNGVNWIQIDGPVVSDGEEQVKIPANAIYSTSCLLRVSDAVNPAINDVTDATFTIIAVTDKLVDLLTMPNNAMVVYTGKATVTYARTFRNQKYIQDATAAVVIDDPTTAPGFISGTYAVGDGITNILGKIVLYGGLVELSPVSVTGEPTTENPVIVPQVRTIESLTHADQCKLVTIEKFTFATTGEYANSSLFVASRNYTITGFPVATFAYRTLFSEADYIGTEIPLAPVTAVCLVGEFNGQMQITARNLADFKFTQADVTSTAYTVVFETSVIKDVPEADNLSVFKSNLTPASGATFEVFDADGTTPATVLDNTKLVIVTAQDGTTKKTYTIEITPYIPSAIANLTKLMYNGTNVNGFLSGVTDYQILLPVGTSVIPEVTYTLADEKASAQVTNATNLFGTEAERTSKVTVTAEDGVTIKTYSIVFTVDNTGIGNNGFVKLNIYPVPAGDELTVSGLANVKRLEILDITGKVIQNVDVTDDVIILHLSNLRKGMYFLRTESQTLKFIKK